MRFSPTELAERVQNAKSLVVLTGAGISTEAGLPDFRGPRGLYTTGHYDPDRVFEIGYFKSNPRMFFEFSLDLMKQLEQVTPTFTHRFLTALEKENRLDCIITQNIDTIHQIAGSRRVLEIHGSYWGGQCMRCGARASGLDLSWWRSRMQRNAATPVIYCESCGGVFKPDVVFFGENVHRLDEAQDLAARCDLMLVLGSSLAVYPAAALPRLCKGFVAVVNQGPVEFSPGPNRILVQEDLDTVFRAVAAGMGLEIA